MIKYNSEQIGKSILSNILYLGLSPVNIITNKSEAKSIFTQEDDYFKLITEKELSTRISKPYTKKHYIEIATDSVITDQTKKVKDIIKEINKIIDKIGLDTISSIWPFEINIIISSVKEEFNAEGYCRGLNTIIINVNALNEKTLLHELCHIFQRNVDQNILYKNDNNLTNDDMNIFNKKLLKIFDNLNIIQLHNPDALTLTKINDKVSIPIFDNGIKILIIWLNKNKFEIIPYSEEQAHPLEAEATLFENDPKSLLLTFNNNRYNDIMN